MSQQQEDLINKMVLITTEWHKKNIGNIDGILSLHDSRIQLGSDSDENPIFLEGDALKGFHMGLIVCKEWFGNLPFTATPTAGPSRELAEGEELPEPAFQKIYLFTEDLGDGSQAVRYTKDPDLLDRLCDNKNPYADYFLQNEGYSRTLTFPAGVDLEAAGFDFYEEN